MGVQLVGSAKLMRFVNDTKVNIVCWANYETQQQKQKQYKQEALDFCFLT